MKFVAIRTSTNDIDIAMDISNSIINKKLSPCVQIKQNCIAVYNWNDNIVKDKEHIITIKTIDILKEDIVDIIKSYHNYDVPEITLSNGIVLSKKYARWFKKCLKK